MKTWMRYTLVAAVSAALGGMLGLAADPGNDQGVLTVDAAAPAADPDPLATYETERQQLRAREEAQLNDIIHDDATDADTLRVAQRRLIARMEAREAEETLQGNLRARGFEGAVACVWDGGVTVFVRSEALNRSQTAVILDEVLRETGHTGGNVKIIPINSRKVFAH